MKILNIPSKSRRNYYVDLAALLPFIMLLFTGIVLLMYHSGKPIGENTLGHDGSFWLNIHIVCAVISLVMIGVHLSLHLSWFKKLFTGQLKNKYKIRNLVLVVLFLLTTITAVVPMFISEESNAAAVMLGLHNKIGLLLIIFFVIHLLTYFRWLVGTTKKVFGKYSM